MLVERHNHPPQILHAEHIPSPIMKAKLIDVVITFDFQLTHLICHLFVIFLSKEIF